MTLVVTIIAVVVVVYVWSVFHYPRQRCRRCQAFSGRDHSPLGRFTYRKCRKCKGTGWHIRPMRRILGGSNLDDGSGVWQGP